MKRDLNYGQQVARQNVGQVLIQSSCRNTSTAIKRAPSRATAAQKKKGSAVCTCGKCHFSATAPMVHLFGGMVLWCTTLGKETLNQCALNGTEVGVVQWSEDV